MKHDELMSRFGASEIAAGTPLRHERYSGYKCCGYFGLVLAFVQSAIVVSHLDLAQLTLWGITGVAVLSFSALTMAAKILAGEEIIVFYHHGALFVATTALFLRVSGQPVLPYLDITIIGLGMFLACGRLGCLSVGCCHGRPSRWGVRYGREAVETGFPSWLEGVRLFPVQALESLWVFCIVVAGTVWIWKGSVPGAVFAFYIVAYAFGRFFLEFLRGDEDRPYWLGFSEAQWTSVILVVGVVLAERWHFLPKQFFPQVGLAALLTATLATVILRWMRKSKTHILFSAQHVNEIARTVAFLRSRSSMNDSRGPLSAQCDVASTSQGLQLSFGRVQRFRTSITHFTISHQTRPLRPGDAQSLAKLIVHFCRSTSPSRIVTKSRGIYHILFTERPSPLSNGTFYRPERRQTATCLLSRFSR
jgi:hypothetical protein